MNKRRGISLAGVVILVVFVVVGVGLYFYFSKSSKAKGPVDGMEFFPYHFSQNSAGFIYLYMNNNAFKSLSKNNPSATYASSYGMKPEDIKHAYGIVSAGGTDLANLSFNLSFIFDGSYNAKDIEDDLKARTSKSSTYKNKKIYMMSASPYMDPNNPLSELNLTACFCRIGSKVIVTMSEDDMKKIIDQIVDGGKSLKDCEGVKELLTKISPNDIFGIFTTSGSSPGKKSTDYQIAGLSGKVLSGNEVDVTIVYVCKDASSASKVLTKEKNRIQSVKDNYEVSFNQDGKFVVGKYKTKNFMMRY